MTPEMLARVISATRRKADAGHQQSTAVVEGLCQEAERLVERVVELEGLVEGHTMRGDQFNLLSAQVAKWAADQTDFKPDEVYSLAKAIYPDFMAIIGYGLPTNGVQCPKCDGPARYLVNVETGTTLLCPKCPHAWSIDQKDEAP